MAGLSAGRTEEPSGNTREMVPYFTSEYKPVASFIIAMLVVAELKRACVEFTEENEVRSVFRSLVSGAGENALTDEGMKPLNAYANGGYEYLAQHCDQRPQSAEEFLRVFADLIGEAVPTGPFAAG